MEHIINLLRYVAIKENELSSLMAMLEEALYREEYLMQYSDLEKIHRLSQESLELNINYHQSEIDGLELILRYYYYDTNTLNSIAFLA